MSNGQIVFKDFSQQQVVGVTMYAIRNENIEEILIRVNAWLEQQNGTVVNIETLFFDNKLVLRV
ncbi:hypothetical protein AH580_19535 [Salmonella enterica subsp. enterica serovar Montevideo]|uniref:hypothetical protein n=1 Tax=Salmonella enterica TaxID=28901 RepID=UPI0009AF7BD6|nr:hypothetical protein [Salmonella enterica]EBZ2217464.1 hypothetical protein [Salmonella enterica subsp. enterica serovar Montevideo]ECA9146963.1 hypothetical protein [Salmonella enterica subsp. enterica serovar Montevideo]EDE7749349.1 hypothetical protein [Salmonella enterica subsp. enterica serovar Montevideo]EEK7292513.1 hypothetical protein [Salmonella enterica subsp. enterica serovar Montevideo]